MTPVMPPGCARDAVHVLCVGGNAARFREFARFASELNGITLDHAASEAEAVKALEAGGCSAVFAFLDGDPAAQLRRWDERLRPLPQRPRLMAVVSAPSVALTLMTSEIASTDLLTLPLGRAQLHVALERLRLAATEIPIPLPDASPVSVGPHQFVSQSPAMFEVCRRVAQVAPSTASVLILGESGTGKELLARAIHQQGPRSTAPFVALNCAAIPENLLESELFGHEKGAFTGAIARKTGRFERAHGGTLLLDEIGDMSLALQSKILRALQEREIERVGGTQSIPVDVRLIAATNRDLHALIKESGFREDLYYRLAVVTISLPRLTERGEDLLLLTAHFVAEFQRQCGKRFSAITDRALSLLANHDWPGNVRELRNVIERAVVIAEGDTLRAEHLPEQWRTRSGEEPHLEPGRELTLEQREARQIAEVLAATGGHISAAARILGVHRNTLARKMLKYRL
jgi:two-component system response regulator HydG